MGKFSDFFNSQGIPLPHEQKRQVLALDKQFETLESKLKVLDAENLKLKAEVNPLKQEVERLKKQIEQEAAPSHKLEQSETDMLLLIAEHPNGLTSPQISGMLKLHTARTEHFLGLLTKKNFILAILRMGGHARYVLDDGGNEYLVKNNLV